VEGYSTALELTLMYYLTREAQQIEV